MPSDEVKATFKTGLVSPLRSRFKTLMTNKSEQDGSSSKTIEISDMKYHIFQVCGSRCCVLLRGGVGGDAASPGSLALASSIWAEEEAAVNLSSSSAPSPAPSVFC